MDNNFLRFYKPNVLLYLLIGLSIIVFLGSFVLSSKLSFIVFSIVIGLLIVIDKFLWCYSPFKYLFQIPDFSGKYKGILKYEYKDKYCKIQTGELQHKKEILQSGSSLIIQSYTYKDNGELSSHSESINVAVQDKKDGSYKLIYTYLNEGDPDQGFPPHFGTEVIKFIEKNGEKFLEGSYYTNRVPIQTRGKFINMKKIQ